MASNQVALQWSRSPASLTQTRATEAREVQHAEAPWRQLCTADVASSRGPPSRVLEQCRERSLHMPARVRLAACTGKFRKALAIRCAELARKLKRQVPHRQGERGRSGQRERGQASLPAATPTEVARHRAIESAALRLPCQWLSRSTPPLGALPDAQGLWAQRLACLRQERPQMRGGGQVSHRSSPQSVHLLDLPHSSLQLI